MSDPSDIKAEEDLIVGVWSGYWKDRAGQVEDWDSLSQIVLSTVLTEAGRADLSGLKILEAGCGTGRISLRLARAGAEVTCLDAAAEALVLARETFGPTPATFIQGSIFQMPQCGPCDLIWSSGVLEHFRENEQRQALGEFLRELRPGGKIVVLNPYAGSVPYRLVKSALELARRWPYGRELPVWTLSNRLPPGSRLEREYTVSFLPFFLDAYKIVPSLRPLCELLAATLRRFLGESGLVRLDSLLSRWLGGYLLVSVVVKASSWTSA